MMNFNSCFNRIQFISNTSQLYKKKVFLQYFFLYMYFCSLEYFTFTWVFFTILFKYVFFNKPCVFVVYSQEKPHKCTLCAKSFPTPGDLKSHMYVHNGSWPFKCHICNRGFSKHTNLKNHLFLHTGKWVVVHFIIHKHLCRDFKWPRLIYV